MENQQCPLSKSEVLSYARIIGEQAEDFLPSDVLTQECPDLWEESLKDYVLENSLSLVLESGKEEWTVEIVDQLLEGMRSGFLEPGGPATVLIGEILFRIREEVLRMLN
ncbi:hypothetical protein Y981_07360 [Leptospirillum ferriphilum YSK]|uniref:Uncharacterized protein n=1 Tax=Leptospirillum ferriphilum YSK TaxID=1441628 RepID=A0A059XXF3_9BACT|nr:hypothetical protein Y981_07360 [Leptospirillum ferriphilum YSK]